eukprot:UC4_evm2s74
MSTVFRDPFLMESDDSDSDDNDSYNKNHVVKSTYCESGYDPSQNKQPSRATATASLKLLTNTQQRNEISGGREPTSEPTHNQTITYNILFYCGMAQQEINRNDSGIDQKSSSSNNFNWSGFSQVAELQKQNAELVLALDKARSQANAHAHSQASSTQNNKNSDNTSISEAMSRVAALSKKIRVLNSSLEAEKSKYKKSDQLRVDLEQKVEVLQRELHKKDTTLKRLQSKPNKESSDLVSPTSHNTASSSEYTNHNKGAEGSKLRQLWRQNQSLKKDLQLAHRAISKEVGENISVSTILSSQSDWKGRAEQIALLRGKIAMLQGTGSQLKPNRPAGHKYSSSGVNPQTRAHLRKLENSKKEAQRAAEEESAQLKIQNIALQEKIDALKARIKVLSRELKQYKCRQQELAQQAVKDGKTIQGLNEKLENRGMEYNLKPKVDVVLSDNIKLKELCREQRKAVEDLKKTVSALHQQLRSNTSRGSTRSSSRQKLFSNSEDLGSNEKNINSLTALAEIETRLSISEVERKKLVELVEVLRRQIGEEEEKSCQLNLENRERIRCAQQLQDRLTYLENNTSEKNITKPLISLRPEESERKLALLKDENEVLRMRLNDMVKRKKDELEVYDKLLQEARRAYAQGLKSFRAAQFQDKESKKKQASVHSSKTLNQTLLFVRPDKSAGILNSSGKHDLEGSTSTSWPLLSTSTSSLHVAMCELLP